MTRLYYRLYSTWGFLNASKILRMKSTVHRRIKVRRSLNSSQYSDGASSWRSQSKISSFSSHADWRTQDIPKRGTNTRGTLRIFNLVREKDLKLLSLVMLALWWLGFLPSEKCVFYFCSSYTFSRHCLTSLPRRKVLLQHMSLLLLLAFLETLKFAFWIIVLHVVVQWRKDSTSRSSWHCRRGPWRKRPWAAGILNNLSLV